MPRKPAAKPKRKPRPMRVHPDYVRMLDRIVDAFAAGPEPTAKGYLAAARVLINEALTLERRP